MRKLLVSLVILLLAFSNYAQVENANQSMAEMAGPKFYEDFLNFSAGKPGETRIDAFVSVPYKTIQFVKEGSLFSAKYTVTVSVFDEDEENLIVEKTWNETIHTKKFAQTIDKKNFNLSLRSIFLQPAEYSIRTALEDKDSKKTYVKKAKLKVRNLSTTFAISDVMLISRRTVVDGKNRITPNVTRNVATSKQGLPFFFELYAKKPARLNLDYTVRDKVQNIVFHDDEYKNIDSGKTQLFHTIKDSSFSLGSYNLTIEVRDSTNKVVASVGKSFFSHWEGVPSSIKDLDKAIAQMLYIATPSQLDSLTDAKTKQEKMKRYMKFWKKKDPTPNTDDNPVFDEYYRRVAYANEHFSSYIEGWRSDRGMVFILLGPPNSVDRHPFDIDSKPYVIWQYYNLNQSFIFVDETGFGDYRLVTPLTGDLYRFRYQ